PNRRRTRTMWQHNPRIMNRWHYLLAPLCGATLLLAGAGPPQARKLGPVDVEGPPLAGNGGRVLKALEFLGTPLAPEHVKALKAALEDQDAGKIQAALDPHVLFVVHVNPEARVKVKRGPAPATLQQGGHTPVLVKVVNESGVT